MKGIAPHQGKSKITLTFKKKKKNNKPERAGQT
jgi:hypothetical protein